MTDVIDRLLHLANQYAAHAQEQHEQFTRLFLALLKAKGW